MPLPPLTNPEFIPEKRLSERRILRTSAALALITNPNAATLKVRTLDISATGLGVISSVSLKPNIDLDVKFLLPGQMAEDSVEIKTIVKIQYCLLSASPEGFKIGLRFTDLDPDASSAILRFIQR